MIAYGQLVTDLISFVIVALVVFVIVQEVHKYTERAQPTATTRSCPFCLTVIPLQATRCPACTTMFRESPVNSGETVAAS